MSPFSLIGLFTVSSWPLGHLPLAWLCVLDRRAAGLLGRHPSPSLGLCRTGQGEAGLPAAGGALLPAREERLAPGVPGEEARQPARDGVSAASLQTGPAGAVGAPPGGCGAAGEDP